MQRKWQVLLVTAVAVFMGFLDVSIVNVAFPDIQRSFPDTSEAGLSWVLNAYNVVFAALLVPAGRAADLIGRRRTFFIGMAVFLVASALCAAAPTVELLVAARVLQAVGAAILIPTSLGLLLPEFPPEQVREPPRGHQQRREDDVVGVQDPREAGDRRAGKGALDAGKGDVDDRHVDEGHEDGRGGDGEHLPPAPGPQAR